MRRNRLIIILLSMILALSLLAGCGIRFNWPPAKKAGGVVGSKARSEAGDDAEEEPEEGGKKSKKEKKKKSDKGSDENEAESEVNVSSGGRSGNADGTPIIYTCDAPGTVLYKSDDAEIDASNAQKGYVMMRYMGNSEKVRILVDTPQGNRYNYLCPLDATFHAYPLSEGSGLYSVGVYENVSGSQYAMVFAQELDVTLENDHSGYLYPNIYVDFDDTTQAVQKGAELAAGAADDLTVVSNVYHYIYENVSYDYDLAKTVGTDYVPIVDETLASGKGICFDYASLMASMLRTQGIPTRLEIGYAKEEYHAWISTYLADIGWVDGLIAFDGAEWTLMDPTLASTGAASTVRDYMENKGSFYQIVYKY